MNLEAGRAGNVFEGLIYSESGVMGRAGKEGSYKFVLGTFLSSGPAGIS
jgi:hypothetical protein